MSSPFTLNYLASYLWLKGSRKTLGSFRTILNAHADNEILLLGEGIKFEFIPKEDVDSFIKANEVDIPDYYVELFIKFIKYAPNSPDREYWVKKLKIPTYEMQLVIDDDEIEEMREQGEPEQKIQHEIGELEERIKIDSLMPFYANAQYRFNRSRAEVKFKEFAKFSYADKDIIDYEKYEFITRYEDIPFEAYLYAYVYGGVYTKAKLGNKLDEKTLFWKTVNALYENKFIYETVHVDTFMNYYKKYLGAYQNIDKDIAFSDKSELGSIMKEYGFD